MGSLTALLLATPIFGFSLQAPALEAQVDLSAKTVVDVAMLAKVDDEDKDASPSGKVSAEEAYQRDLKLRNDIAGVHRIFGISTWIAMTLTLVAGAIDYYNLYGAGADIGDNPCVSGDAVFGDEFGCRGGIRTIKSGLAYITGALYTTTFVLSLMMPDPDDLSSGKGEFASTLRLHKTLRWVHFAGMLVQIALGVVIAGRVGGLDRANDYGTLQALSTVHLGVGLVTWGAMSWAGALMTF
jgi:hypothetical protein